MVRLEKINGKNVWDALMLSVSENQREFVASNDISIIEAYKTLNIEIMTKCKGIAYILVEKKGLSREKIRRR